MVKTISIEDCDRRTYEAWVQLRDNPQADPESCRRAIDAFLDARLELMKDTKEGKRNDG